MSQVVEKSARRDAVRRCVPPRGRECVFSGSKVVFFLKKHPLCLDTIFPVIPIKGRNVGHGGREDDHILRPVVELQRQAGKRAISVVFWWSPAPQRNAPSLVLQSGAENINTGLPGGSKHTHQHVNHDVIPDIVLPDCLGRAPTLCLPTLNNKPHNIKPLATKVRHRAHEKANLANLCSIH